jgi:hypothetical protein
MVLVGLGLLGLVRLPGGFEFGPSRRLAGQVSGGGRGAFLLGVAFSFAFCPTLFWLFFGLTVPLALPQPRRMELPGCLRPRHGLTAAGAGCRGVSRLGCRRPAGRRGARWHRPVKWVAGAAFIVAGLHDTLMYWWL